MPLSEKIGRYIWYVDQPDNFTAVFLQAAYRRVLQKNEIRCFKVAGIWAKVLF